MSMPESVTFNVTRQEPELLPPTQNTPNELKELTMIDQMVVLRMHTSFIQIYRSYDHAKGKDPAHVIKKAIAQALVYYYPLAGRLKEIDSKKTLVVDCTGEGVMFVEADADCSVNDFGEIINPPFPGGDELLFHPIPNSITDSPLLLFQVTRFKCGGFALGITMNHVLVDATGMTQFMRAVSELARGFPSPSLLPVWERHLLRPRDPPQVTFKHKELAHGPSITTQFFSPEENMVTNSFLFDTHAIASIRHMLTNDQNIPYCSTFELVSALIWRARAISMKLDSAMDAHFIFPIRTTNHFNPPIPTGYYGNVIVSKLATTAVGELKENNITHAIEVIKKAKEEASEEYTRSTIDHLFLHGHFPPARMNALFISDLRRMGFHEMDYGWGKAAYGAAAEVNTKTAPEMTFSILVPLVNDKFKEIGTAVPITLTKPIMESFVSELNVMMDHAGNRRTWRKITSTLFRWKFI